MSLLAIDFNKYKRISSNFVRFTALQFESIESQSTRKQKLKVIAQNLYHIFCIINIVVFYIFTCKLMFEKSRGNVKLLFYLFCTGESTGVALVRLVYTFIIKADIGRISNLLVKSYSKPEAEYYNLNDDIKHFKRIMNVYLGSGAVTVIFFILEPLLTLIFTGERTFGNMTPFGEAATSIEIYPFALFWTIWQFSNLVASIVGVEILLYNAITITIAEFRKLKKDFEDLRTSERLTDDVRKLIKRHNELFEIVKRLEAAYSFPLFLNFYSTALLICFTAFQASTSSDPAELIGMAYFCLSSLFQLFVPCYFGDLLTTVSEDVLNGIYECGWEEMNNMAVRRELPFIIKRARIAAKLTVMKIADVSLFQFANVS
jgi:hypothetical protein